MVFFVDGLQTPIFSYSRGCQPFGKPRKSRKVKHTGKPLFFLHTFARKKPRFQVPVSKEKKLCKYALVQKNKQLPVSDGIEESGYFRKACLDLVQVSGFCLLKPAVGGDHRCIFGMAEVSLMSLASTLATRKPLPMTSIGNSELCHDFCRGSGYVMSRCLCGICTVASLGFPSGLWGLFLCLTCGLFCDISILTTTSPLQ